MYQLFPSEGDLEVPMGEKTMHINTKKSNTCEHYSHIIQRQPYKKISEPLSCLSNIFRNANKHARKEFELSLPNTW